MSVIPYLFTCLSAALLVGSFPPFDFYPLAWVALVPLFFAVRGSGRLKASFLFFLSSFLVFLGLLHWLSVFGWYAWIGAAAYEAAFSFLWGFASFDFLTAPNSSFLNLLFPALACAGMETLRNLGPLGMPWGDLAYTQWRFLPVVEWSGLFGAIGLSFLIALCNVLLFHGIGEKRIMFFPSAAACFVLPAIFGLFVLRGHAASSVSVAILQTNIPQTLKWNRADYQASLSELDRLVTRAGELHPDLILFPETALAGYLERDPGLQSRVESWARKTGTYLAVGTLKAVDGSPENAVVLVQPDGFWPQSYAKIKLVPFGEYLPLFFRPLRGKWHALDPIVDFKPGSGFTVFHFPKGDFGVMICFESSFGWISRAFVRNGASFLAVATNDAWFEGTNAQEEHAAMGVFRAAETRRSFIQAGNTGISCILDPWGRIFAWQAPKTEAVVSGKIPLMTAYTLYDRIGEVYPWFWILAPFFLYYAKVWSSGDAKGNLPKAVKGVPCKG